MLNAAPPRRGPGPAHPAFAVGDRPSETGKDGRAMRIVQAIRPPEDVAHARLRAESGPQAMRTVPFPAPGDRQHWRPGAGGALVVIDPQHRRVMRAPDPLAGVGHRETRAAARKEDVHVPAFF
jgi:hypothetical protein